MKIKLHEATKAVRLGNSLLVFGSDTGAVRNFAKYCFKTLCKEKPILFLGEEIATDSSILAEKIESDSLFESEKMIHIVNVNESQGKIVEKILQKNTSCFVLIETGNLTAKSSLRRHFEYGGNGLYAMGFYPPIDKKSWIREHARKYKLSMEEDVVELLSQYFSHNTIFNQENFLRLSLVFGQKKISEQDAMQILQNNSLISLWDVYEACILKKKIDPQQAMDSYTPLGLLRGLSRHIQSILEAKRTNSENQNVFFLHRKSLAKQKLASEEFLIQALSISISGETLCKRGGQDQGQICRHAVTQILNL